jgi:hypothetical protein
MRRDSLEHAICTACQIIDRSEVIEERRRPDADRAVAWLESWKRSGLTLGVLRRGSPHVPFEVPQVTGHFRGRVLWGASNEVGILNCAVAVAGSTYDTGT